MSKNIGVISTGIKTPIIKEGDDIVKIVTEKVIEFGVEDRDVIGVTESVIARANGLYATVNEIAKSVDKLAHKEKEKVTILYCPIYSRNRFSVILRGIARSSKKIVMIVSDFDSVGNPSGVNPFTGVNILDYYANICKEENCEIEFKDKEYFFSNVNKRSLLCADIFIDCALHKTDEIPSGKLGELFNDYLGRKTFTLRDICSDKNPDFGVLGSNKASDEKVKLFPTKEMATDFCKEVKNVIFKKTNKKVYVCSYGDGCFKSLEGEIWECADPTTMPGYTNPELFESTPNEIKIKAFADDEFACVPSGEALDKCVRDAIQEKENNLVGNMKSQGTTPRLYRDLLASLMDLTSGSGDKGTPVVLVRNYFENFTNN